MCGGPHFFNPLKENVRGCALFFCLKRKMCGPAFFERLGKDITQSPGVVSFCRPFHHNIIDHRWGAAVVLNTEAPEVIGRYVGF
jgi:hypothetical protein